MALHPVFDLPQRELTELRRLPPDRAIAEAARRRDGVLSRRQLVAIGLSEDAVTRRVARGLLFAEHRGVFAVGRPELTARGRRRAALLRHGRRAALSWFTAATALDLLDPRSRIDLTVDGRPRPAPAGSGVRVHLTRGWSPREVRIVDGLPCTSVARTLADLAGGPDARAFTHAWNAADGLLLLDLGELGQQVTRHPTGVARLRERLDRYTDEPPLESVLEELFYELCRAEGLPRPVTQWPLHDGDRHGRVDFVFPGLGVAVEVDGRRWHAIQAAHERDRARDLRLRELGLDPHRYTYRQVADEGPRVAAAVRQALALGSARRVAQ